MKKATIKEIHKFLKTLEENRYRKLVKSECRRIAWFVNNDLSEDYDAMPDSLRKKWVKAEFGYDMERKGTITYKTSSLFVKEKTNTLEEFFS